MKITLASPATLPVQFVGKRHQVGLAGVSYYTGFYPFLNWWKGTGHFELNSPTNGGWKEAAAAFSGGYLDTSGELINPVPRDVKQIRAIITDFQGGKIPNLWEGEEIVVTWDGRGANAFFLNSPGAAAYDQAKGRASFVIGAKAGSLYVGFTMQAGGYSDPPRNIKVFQKRYENETVIDGITYPGINQGGLFNPHWLHEMRKFGRLRYMDWGPTNNSNIVDYADWADEAYFRWGRRKGTTGRDCTKSGVPLSVICALAEQAGADIHFCIPHQATDNCIQSIAAYMAANFPAAQKLIVEYSNEVWNGSFAQYAWTNSQTRVGDKWGGNGRVWTGYRAAQVMKMFRDAFNDRRRWRGCFATQTAFAVPTAKGIQGINLYLSEWNTATSADTLNINDLFDELAVTGYFGDILTPKQIFSVSKAANAFVTTTSAHGRRVGDRITFSIKASTGMVELDSMTATILSVPSSTTFTVDVDTTGFTTYVDGGFSYIIDGKWMDTVAASIAKEGQPGYPTKYDYFAEQLGQAALTGSSDSGIVQKFALLGGANQIATYWLAQKAIADANGLDFTQYEGGCHILGDAFISAGDTGVVGNTWNEFMDYAAYSAPMAKVYAEMARHFAAIGGKYPSKYVEGGSYGKFGRWAGVRWWVSNGVADPDTDNPIWMAIKAANAVYFVP